MSDRTQFVMLLLSILAGATGWLALGLWWYREHTKTVRGIKSLRRTNDRLQKTVMFTLDKWRNQIERQQIMLAIEQAYADRLAGQAGVSAAHVKTSVRAAVEQAWKSEQPMRTDSDASAEYRRGVAAFEEVERYVRNGEGRLAELTIEDDLRRAA